MSARRWLPALLTVTAVASADVTTRPTGGADDPAVWVARLADRDSVVRRDAVFQLEHAGARADAALQAALADPRPAVADLAAELVLRRAHWSDPGDPQSVKLTLIAYASTDPATRAGALSTMLISSKLPEFHRVTLRTLARDPSPLVAWLVLSEVQVTEDWKDWEAVIAAFDRPSALPPASILLRARCREAAGDEATAATLARAALDAERARPTATGELLGWAFQTVINADLAAGRYAEAAGRLRDQIVRTGEDEERGLLLDRLLDLQIRHGPLPAIDTDLRDVDDLTDGHATTSIALMADRVGLPVLGGALLGAALCEVPGEADSDRTARLYEAGETLERASYLDAACRVFENAVATGSDAAIGRVNVAYLHLSKLHLQAGRPALAAYCLQQAIDRSDGPVGNPRNGPAERWTAEDQQGCVYWYYLLDARQRRDPAAVAKFARLVLDSGTTDGGVFLDTACDLPAVAKPSEMEDFFNRTFERARTRVLQSPDEPVLYNDIAWLCARSGRRLNEAVTWAEKAVELAPGESAYLDTLAEARFRTGRVKEAIELEEQALQREPENDVFMTAQLARFRVAATQPSH